MFPSLFLCFIDIYIIPHYGGIVKGFLKSFSKNFSLRPPICLAHRFRTTYLPRPLTLLLYHIWDKNAIGKITKVYKKMLYKMHNTEKAHRSGQLRCDQNPLGCADRGDNLYFCSVVGFALRKSVRSFFASVVGACALMVT